MKIRIFNKKINEKMDRLIELWEIVVTAPDKDKGRILTDKEVEEFYEKYPTYKSFAASDWYYGDEWVLTSIRSQQRDKCICQYCGDVSTKSHHIRNVYNYPKWMYYIDNVVSECDKCHKKIHDRKRISYNKNK